METVIRAEGLTKHYGPVVGIEDLDLEVRAGEIFGFLGPNGSGKSTTIRCLLDLLRPTRGRSEVLGVDPREGGAELRRRIGYMPGDLALYRRMTVRQHLEWFAALRGADPAVVVVFAERFDLDLARPVGDLSTGNRQKVGLVQAFMHHPSLLILDEPTRGLDPLMQQEFHAALREARAEGRTVFLSSHVLDEVEAVADRVAIVREGRLVVTEDMATLKRQSFRVVRIEFGEEPDPAAFRHLPGLREAELDGRLGRFVVEGSMDALVKAAAAFAVEAITSHEPDLEEIFLVHYARGGLPRA